MATQRGLLHVGKRNYACLEKPLKIICRFEVKVNFKKAATAHIVFSVTFWKSHSWCVLWTGLVAADSGSGWIRNLSGKISDTEPEMSTRQHWSWEELSSSENTQWESRKEITFLLVPNQWGFCFLFLSKCVLWAGEGWTCPSEDRHCWKQAAASRVCDQNNTVLFLSFFSLFQNNS